MTTNCEGGELVFKQIFNLSERTADVITDTTFDNLIINPTITESLSRYGYTKPSPVQEKSIPIGLLGMDMLVQAKTGTGKTLVFAILCADHLINAEKRQQTPHVIIVSPTREIAMQSYEVVRKICPKKFYYGLFVGGVDITQDKNILRKGCQVAVGTSGRLAHLTKIKFLNLKNVAFFVLDEADKLMEDSYRSEINYLFSNLTKDQAQVCVFSATYPRNLDQVLCNYMKEPSLIRLNEKDCQLIGVKQYIVYEENILDLELLLKILKTIVFTQCLIFTNDQKRCKTICNYLNKNELSAFYFSALLTQEERFKVIKDFKSFSNRILVSSDLSSRGIDVDHVNLVINLGCIKSVEQYLHRIGRAGRFGTKGAALTIITNDKELYRFKLLLHNKNLNIKILNLNEKYANDLTSNFDFFENCAKNFNFENENCNNFFTNVNSLKLKYNKSDEEEEDYDLEKKKKINVPLRTNRTKYYLRSELLEIRDLATEEQWLAYGKIILGFEKSKTLCYLSKKFYSENVRKLSTKKQNINKPNDLLNKKQINLNPFNKNTIDDYVVKENETNSKKIIKKPLQSSNSLPINLSKHFKYIYSKEDLYAINDKKELNEWHAIFMELMKKNVRNLIINNEPFQMNSKLKCNFARHSQNFQKREKNEQKNELKNEKNVLKNQTKESKIETSIVSFDLNSYFSFFDQLKLELQEFLKKSKAVNMENSITEKPSLFNRKSREEYCNYIDQLTKIIDEENKLTNLL